MIVRIGAEGSAHPFGLWTNIFGNLDNYDLPFRQIQLAIQTIKSIFLLPEYNRQATISKQWLSRSQGVPPNEKDLGSFSVNIHKPLLILRHPILNIFDQYINQSRWLQCIQGLYIEGLAQD